jgi:RNA polymerase sigma factor (sigma-70 family)
VDRTKDNAKETSTHVSLLLRVRDLSDVTAWQDFVRSYTPRIFRWCRRSGLQEADAADATQTVLLKLVKALQTFEYDGQRGRFRGWLKTVSCHVAADVLNLWKARGSSDSQLLQCIDSSAVPADESLFEEIERGYREELLRRARAEVQLRVQPQTFAAWQITTEEQLPVPQVANELHMPVSEIYVARSRVLRMLRETAERMEREDNGESESSS